MAGGTGQDHARNIVEAGAHEIEREIGVTIDSEARDEVLQRLLGTDVVDSLATDKQLRERVTDATKTVFRQAATFGWAQQQELTFAGPGGESTPPVIGAFAFVSIHWPWPFGPA